jgi:high-affinity iron transporter
VLTRLKPDENEIRGLDFSGKAPLGLGFGEKPKTKDLSCRFEIEIYFQLGYNARRVVMLFSLTPNHVIHSVESVERPVYNHMLSSFIIILREGFESFLLVAVILTYLRKTGLRWLTSTVYAAIAVGLSASALLGYVLRFGVEDATIERVFGQTMGSYVSTFLGNEALREAVLGSIAIVMVASLVIHMWRNGPKLREKMHKKLGAVSSHSSRLAAIAGVFLFTFLMITREGMETALMLLQVRDSRLVYGALLGLVAALGLSLAWARYGHLINVKRFFQVTGVFLLLFMLQVAIYTFHEFAEVGWLPNSEVLHDATEKFSPDGLYGKWFSLVMVGGCAVWLLAARLKDRVKTTEAPAQNVRFDQMQPSGR